jgi:hypothetical protein
MATKKYNALNLGYWRQSAPRNIMGPIYELQCGSLSKKIFPLARSRVAYIGREHYTPHLRGEGYPSAQGRLPESLHFAESDVILGAVRARSVHKAGYGHNCDRAAA